MTFTIGYPIYNKAHMIPEIISGLADNIKIPVDYIFIFDGCTDDSEKVFDSLSHKLLGTITKIHTENLFQLRTNNLLMKEFKTDSLIIFQDDMVLTDKNFIENINKVYYIYKDELGIIGCRDGFEKNYSEMLSSSWSGSKFPGCRDLAAGEFAERSMINIGPIVLSRRVVDLVGYFDEIYDIGAYEETEYALKCKYEHGLKNIVLQVDLIHSKFTHKLQVEKNHTSKKQLYDQYSINGPIFNTRWHELAGYL